MHRQFSASWHVLHIKPDPPAPSEPIRARSPDNIVTAGMAFRQKLHTEYFDTRDSGGPHRGGSSRLTLCSGRTVLWHIL